MPAFHTGSGRLASASVPTAILTAISENSAPRAPSHPTPMRSAPRLSLGEAMTFTPLDYTRAIRGTIGWGTRDSLGRRGADDLGSGRTSAGRVRRQPGARMTRG